MEGWIKLHRKLLENLIFNNEKGLKIWIWCLLKANHKVNTFLLGRQKMIIKKGQFVFGSNHSSEELKLAKSTIWYWLEFLEREGQVELKKTNKYTIITMKNWDKYQEVGNKSETNEETNGKQIGTNKNVKNVKNDKNIPTQALVGNKINNLINLFKEVNPSYERLFANKTQRVALERMVAKWGYEKMENGIKFLPQILGKKYAPTITTPIQLENKMGELIVFIKKERSGNKVNIVI